MAKPTPAEGVGPDTPLDGAARRILSARLHDVHAAGDRLFQPRTPDSVHDLRVASRRLRAALTLFARHELTEARVEVRRLGRALGDVRDLDLQIAWLDRALDERPAEEQGSARSLLVEKRTRLADRESALRQVFDRWTGVAARLARSLDALELGERGRLGGRPMRRKLGRRLRKLEPLMTEVVDSPDPHSAHRLRIVIKKLRYHAELLEEALPDEIPALLDELKPLQHLLGDLHDHDVRVELLVRWLARAQTQDLPAGRALLAGELDARDRGAAELVSLLRRLGEEKRLRALRRSLK